MSKMIFEIHGGQFQNKGAMKMLVTCIKQLEQRIPNVTFVVDGCVGNDQQLDSLNLKKLLFKRGWMGSKRFTIGLFIQRIIAAVASAFPFLFKDVFTLNKIDGVIDVAGFAYTDQWGYKPSEDFAKLAGYYRQKGKKVVMLPQAFGTFTQPQIINAIEKIINNANLIYARDSSSFKHLLEITNNTDVVKKAPDITLFVKANSSESQIVSNKVAIIPNMRMLDQGSEFWKENYVQYLNMTIDTCIDKGLDPIFVIHDQAGEDIKVAQKALLERADEIQVLQIDDPWELKSMLSTMQFVVGSRFHGLVAALSNDVPVISIGWSHKYAELLSDFGLSEFLISEQHGEKELSSLINILADENQNLLKRNIVKTNFEKQKDINKHMWADVVEVLQGNSR
ncbi:MAG: polysaccharide pyruvyl transferase family protein [Aliiglaciecola sp.]|uniref:polysaccharide pyruvyl transferase family protein n=1 Tax=Aliiglaciecola sp. TaxID=1872441 RepID=UPI00329952A3